MKPQPHVIDVVSKGLHQDLVDLRHFAKSSKRFIFDKEASWFLGKFVSEFDVMAVENRQFALPPFDCTYIEYDSSVFFEALGRPTTSQEFGYDHPNSCIGNLITRYVNEDVQLLDPVNSFKTGWQVMSVARAEEGDYKGVSMVFPLRAIWLDNEGVPIKSHVTAKFALGSTYERLSLQERDEVANQVRISSCEEGSKNKSHLYNLVHASAGELRTLWAALLLINRKGVSFEQQAHRVGILRGKRHVYAAHNIVRLNFGMEPQLACKAMGLVGERNSPRRHAVRGHFKHYHLDRECVAVQIDGQHEWVEFEPRKWRCTCCKTLRTWAEAHERGDAQIGYVTKDYNATTQESHL